MIGEEQPRREVEFGAVGSAAASSMTAAPLPSPIPRAKGSRSAADEIFSQFLESSLHVPDLTLPPENRPLAVLPRHHDNVVDFELLLSKDGDAMGELIRLARGIGAFRINCHGVFEEKLQSSVKQFLQVSEGAFGAVDEEERFRSRFKGRSLDWASRFLEDPSFDCFSEEFKNVESELGAIAKEVLQILSEATDRKLQMDEGEATLSIVLEPENCTRTKISPDRILTSKDSFSPFALRVRLQIDMEQLKVRDSSVLVTIGKQLQEWSHGELKLDSRESVHDQPETRIHGTRTSFSFEYEFSLKTTDQTSLQRTGINRRTISLFDQVMICIFITCLLNIFLYIWS